MYCLHTLWACFSFLRSLENKFFKFFFPKPTQLRDEIIRLTWNVAIKIESELQIHTYIYKRLKCYLSSFRFNVFLLQNT
jgi:hypothetical protein